MKGDFSHWKFDSRENYSGVLQQQGRVLLDRDWNEQTLIDSHRAEETARDVIGRNCAAVPADEPDGFQVTRVVVNAGPDGEDRVELDVRTGRVWADGIPVVLSGESDPVLRVADYFDPPGELASDISSGDRDAVILEVSHEAVNAFQNPERLLEPALGGPDTTERIHTRAAFRLYRLGPNEDCHSIVPNLQDNPANRGRLTVRLQPTVNVPGDCPVVAGGGYTGFEHFLYRIEIARMPDGEEPHFKWSQFNGGLVGRGQLQSTPNRITITANRPAIVNSGINDFYAEVVQWNEDRGFWEVTMGAEVSLSDGELHVGAVRFGTFSASSSRVFFRLWNGIEVVSAFDNTANPQELLDGIQLAFPPAAVANLLANDYWQFAVRAGEIVNEEMLLDEAPPAGPFYHRVPLAELTWASPRIPVTAPELEDCRKRFRSLANQKVCCTYHIGDGVRTFGDFNSLEEAAAHLPPEGGELCLMPGLHFCNVTFTDKRNIRIHGCRDRSWVFPRPKQANQPIVHFEGGRNLSIEDVQFVSFAGACVLVEASDIGAPREVSIAGTRMIALTNAVRVEEGEDVILKENIFHLWDTNFGGAVVSMRAEDVLIERNRLIVRPGIDLPDNPDGGDNGGGDEPTPEDPCATPEEIYETLSEFPTWIAQIWLIAVFGAPAQPYRAQGGLHLRGACARTRVWENRISGGASHGVTLGGTLRHDPLREEDPDASPNDPSVARITIPADGRGFAVRTIDADTGNPIGNVPVFLMGGVGSFAKETDETGFLYSKHREGTYDVNAGAGYAIQSMEVTLFGEGNIPMYILRLGAARIDQDLAFLHEVEIDHNEISRMGLSGIGFTLLGGTEATPAGELLISAITQMGSIDDKALLATTLLATLLSPRELIGTTNPVRGLRISQNSIFGNVLNPFTDEMRIVSQRVSLGGITLPIVDDLSISENEICDNGPNAIDPVCGIFIGHGDNVAIVDNEITGNGPVLDANDYLERRVQGLRSGIFVRFAGSMAMARGSRKPALRVRGNRVDQPAGRALTAFVFGPSSCDGNVFNSEFTGNWNFFDEAVGGVLIVNLGGVHRLLNEDRGRTDQVDDVQESEFQQGLEKAYRGPQFAVGAGSFRNRAAVEAALPGGESLYNNNQIRLGTGHTGYTSQLLVSLDDLGYDANQSSLFGNNLLLSNTVLLAKTVRATDSRFIEDLTRETQPIAISLLTFGAANITVHNQADHCIVAYPNVNANGTLPTISSPNQVRNSSRCGELQELKGMFAYLVGFVFSIQARNSANLTDDEIIDEVGKASGVANVGGGQIFSQLEGARADRYYLYDQEQSLLAKQYGVDDVRALEVGESVKKQQKTLEALRVEGEMVDIAFKDRSAERKADLISGLEGRVSRKEAGGVQGLEVQMIDRRGNRVGPVAKTDASGFYRFALEENELAKLKERDDLFVQVLDSNGSEIRKSKDAVAFGQNGPVNFTIDRRKFVPGDLKPGTPVFTKPVVDSVTDTPLEKLDGIGKVRAERLRESGVENIRSFLSKTNDELARMIETEGSEIVEKARRHAAKIGKLFKFDRPVRGPRPAGDQKSPNDKK